MAHEKDIIWCDGCGVEILWAPLVVAGRDYCCQDCCDGLLCECGDRQEPEERRARSDATVERSGAGGSER